MSCRRFFPQFVLVFLVASIAAAQESPRSAASDVRSPVISVTRVGPDPVPLRDWPVIVPVTEHLPQDGMIAGAPAVFNTGRITSNSAPSPAANFVAVVPCRVVDTRNAPGTYGGPAYTAGQTRSFSIPGSPCTGIPVAEAYSLNFTIVNYDVSSVGFVTAFPTGTPKPFVSTVNFGNGTNAVANAAIVPANGSGSIDVYSSGATNLIIDINGYFTDAGPSKLITYLGSTTATSSFTNNGTLFKTIGTFTKDSASTAVTATWQSHVRTVLVGGGTFCQYQLRIDDLVPTGQTAIDTGSVVYAASQTDQQTSFMGRWTGLAAGTHTLSLYLRGNGATCTDNFGNFARYVYVQEE
jgi:hypothetical protein